MKNSIFIIRKDSQVKHWSFLSSVIKENDIHTFIEVGTAAGNNIRNILELLPEHELEVWCVDPYEYYDEYGDDPKATPDIIQERYRKASNTIFEFDNVHHIREYSEDAAPLFDDESIDMIFLDGNHSYEYVKKDTGLWWPKVKDGGFLSGHDYKDRPWLGVIPAVDEFLEENDLELYDNNHVTWVVKK